jgi:hypothetical protein
MNSIGTTYFSFHPTRGNKPKSQKQVFLPVFEIRYLYPYIRQFCTSPLCNRRALAVMLSVIKTLILFIKPQSKKTFKMSTSPVPVIQAVGPTIQSYLEYIKSQVNNITYPQQGGSPVEIPHYDALYTAAGKLDSLSDIDATQHVNMIMSLLGRANCVGFTAPTTISLPNDHHMHPDAGVEWYWIACHLNVTDSTGKAGRVSVLVDMTRNRCVGVNAQAAAGWTDEQATIANTIANVTVDMGGDGKSYYRRTPNWQWPMKGGSVSFSKPGAGNTFSFTCGADTLTGSTNVLPLVVNINDGSNMQVDLTFTNQPSINVDTAFFLQGAPIIGGNGGEGVTTAPTPGIYYSWPQLLVTGTVMVGGNTYTVTSGTGWVDHQLMMTSLTNANGAYAPVPFVNDPTPYNGWVWQFYNLNNNTAFTGAGFIAGEMINNPPMVYGYYLTPDGSGGWTAIFINSKIDLLDPMNYPAICGDSDSPKVTIPTSRTYTAIESPFLPLDPSAGTATPWYKDGTFNFPDGSLCSEEPADFIYTSGQTGVTGEGYLESVGFQSIADYEAYALSVLKTPVG